MVLSNSFKLMEGQNSKTSLLIMSEIIVTDTGFPDPTKRMSKVSLRVSTEQSEKSVWGGLIIKPAKSQTVRR